LGTRQSLNFFLKKKSLPSVMVMALDKAGKMVFPLGLDRLNFSTPRPQA